MGDLNGSLEMFPTEMALINEHGWTDIGNDDLRCQGKPGRTTCYTKEEAKESRIDFILANNRVTPAIVKCHVDECSDYPTHRPHVHRSADEDARVQCQGTSKAHKLCMLDGTKNRCRAGEGG